MRTTIDIADPVLRELKRRQAQEGKSLGELVSELLAQALKSDRVAEPVSEELGRNGIACWAGDFYAVRPLQAMGIDLEKGVLRMSAVHYTSAEEVSRLIAVLDRVL